VPLNFIVSVLDFYTNIKRDENHRIMSVPTYKKQDLIFSS